MTASSAIVRASLGRCDRIIAGLDELQPYQRDVLPVENDDLQRLDVVQRIAAIAVLKRYEQLQDIVGRLVRAVLDWEAEDVRIMTRRDLANWMEKLRLIDDADHWVDYSDLRNRLVHEYPLDEVEQVDRVNECWAVAPRLVAMVSAVKQHLARGGFPA